MQLGLRPEDFENMSVKSVVGFIESGALIGNLLL